MGKDLIQYHFNEVRDGSKERASVDFIGPEQISKVRDFHSRFEEYKVTPLHNLKNLAGEIGIKGLFLKDESYRFGLNAFKVLGGSYAIGMYLAEKLGIDILDADFDYLKSDEVREKIGEITFVTATDGNHGRGVAWAANQLGQKSVVYMPKNSTQQRVDAIRGEGATVEVLEGNYEACVAKADEMSQKHGWVVIQDTAWDGYEKIPTWIMQGYATLILEAMEQLEEEGISKPTHVLMQAGVGSFAGAVQGFLVAEYGDDRPITAVVEPHKANCLFRSALAGQREIVDGEMDTIMAGLACGAPNTISYEVLRDYADFYLSCPDFVAARGMRVGAAPIKGDPHITTGESGAVGLGVMSLISLRDEYEELREKFQIDEDSIVLVISTEGDTDLKRYREIVWDGSNPSL